VTDGDETGGTGDADNDDTGGHDVDSGDSGDSGDSDRSNPAVAEYSEPDEFDPVEAYGNPEEEMVSVPEVDIPEVENPADRLPDPSEVDKEVKDSFWTAVLWMDIALPCLVLGPIYILLGGSTQIGGAITLAGVLASFRLYQTVRAFEQRRDETADGDDDMSDE
jgi:hypothetical protein